MERRDARIDCEYRVVMARRFTALKPYGLRSRAPDGVPAFLLSFFPGCETVVGGSGSDVGATRA